MTVTARTNSFSRRLDREWERLRRDSRSIRRARAWELVDPDWPETHHLPALRDLQTLVDLTRRGRSWEHRADELLRRLVEIAEHDTLAARVVVQRILPGLISRSMRYRDHYGSTDPIELAVSAAWIAVRGYDWRRRRTHVASSLISDAIFQAFRRPLRLRAATEVVRSPHHFKLIEADDGSTHPLDELVAVLREAIDGGLPDTDVELLGRLVRHGSTVHVAAECGVTPRTIRNRRDAAVVRVRTALAAA